MTPNHLNEDFKMAVLTASEKSKHRNGGFMSKNNIKRLQQVEQIRKLRVKIKNQKRKQNKTGRKGEGLLSLGTWQKSYGHVRAAASLCI